jgi:glycine dehydrogenase subunit 1
MTYGGPWLGFMAVKQALMRKLPGRIAGETVDVDGRRAFVLTLQAREQHIRREKATSNICSNQGLNAMSATIYLSLLGAEGLAEAAKRSMDGAHYLQKKLEAAGFPALYNGPFFDEFAFVIPSGFARAETKLSESGIIGGFNVTKLLPGADAPDGGRDVMLVCVTEKRSKKEMDDFVSVLSEAYA